MNASTDSALYAVIYIVDCAFYIYGSKVGVYYRSTLFADLNLEITGKKKQNLKSVFGGRHRQTDFYRSFA